MTGRLRFLAIGIMCAAATACSGGSPAANPVAPTASGPTLTNLTITPVGGGTLMVGGFAPITSSGPLPSRGGALGAFAQFSNGTGRYVEATWTSSDDKIVTVDGTKLTAIGRGTATVTATYEGRSDNEQFVVEGGVPSSWAGIYAIDQCGATSGSMTEVLCTPPGGRRAAGIAYVGATLPISMDITESGSDLTATVSFGVIRGVLTGKNRGNGLFYLQGTISGNGGSINITQWCTQVLRDTMQGYINYQVRIDGLPGTGSVATHLVNVTRR